MKITQRSLSLLLALTMLLGYFLIPGTQSQVQADCYSSYTLIDTIENYNGCTGMQGMAMDDTYLYNVKIASSTQDNAIITRTHKTSGSTVYMTNAATSTYYFTELYHANDMELVTIDGTTYLFVATSLAGSTSLIRYTLSGTTLTKSGSYDTYYNGSSTAISSAQVMYASSERIDFMIKKGKYLYTASLDPAATSGIITMTHAFTLDVANVTIDGTTYDYTEYLHQGFDYFDQKVFVPITGYPDMSISTIVVYDTAGVSGTIKNDPTLSFYIQSTTYAEKFEIESCEVCPADGRLYFNTNQATASSGNYDAVHYFTNYVYDPAHGSAPSRSYRWEVIDGILTSVTTDGAAYNSIAMTTGTVSGTSFTDARYNLDDSVTLTHDQPWILEWKSSGTWTDGGLLMSSHSKSKYEGNTFIFRRKNSTLIALGTYTGGKSYNYGLQLADYGIDGTIEHTYRMTNKLSDHGTNMVYLSVDGTELGPLNNYHIAGTSQGTTSDWISGKDFTFSYLGTDQHPIDDCDLQYIQVWPQGLMDQRDTAESYQWGSAMATTGGTGLTANTATALAGSVSGTTYTDARYSLAQDVTLLHDRPWYVEWESTGAWTGGSLLLASARASKTYAAPFLFRNSNGLIALGYFDGSKFHNYGLNITDHAIDETASHVYRLENRIENGTNMVYLLVDGITLGAMDGYHVGGTAQGTTGDWVSGKDFVFSYVGTLQHDLNTSMSYLKVAENGDPAAHAPKTYRWETQNGTFTSLSASNYTENPTTTLAGTCTDGTFSGSYFQPDQPIILRHDLPWTMEWESEGTWKDAASGSLLLSHAANGDQVEAPYLYRRHESQIIAFGERKDGGHQNYGIKLSDHGIDGTALHTYRLENRIENGSNMVYLLVDGADLGAMENHFIGGTAQGTTSDWISGKDFVFNYIGNPDFPIGNCSISYLQINEGCIHTYTSTVTTAPTCATDGIRTYTCTACGDSYSETIAATGHDYTATVTAPTCTAEGYTTHTCQNCGDNYTTDSTTKLDHSYDPNVTTAPGCTTTGVRTYTCTACGDSYSETIAATGHSYTFSVTAPTCTAEGYTTHTCQSCGDSYTDTVTAATGHTWADGSCVTCGEDCAHKYANNVCTICGMKKPTKDYYLFGYINGADYACEGDYENLGIYKFTDGKLTAFFTQDSYVAIKSGDNQDWYMLSAYYGENVTAGTLFNTSTGATEKLFVPGGKDITFTLMDNGDDTYTLSYVATACTHPAHDTSGSCTKCGTAVEHTYGEWLETKSATCTEKGELKRTCTICTAYQIQSIAATGHSYSGGTCTACGEADPNAVTQPTLTLKYPSLSFEAEILYNVYYVAENIDDVEEMGLATFDTELADGTVENASDVIPGFETDGTIWKVGTNGISAKDLGDTMYFKVYAKLTDGSYVYSAMKSYSAVSYATTILDRSTSSTYMKSLVVAMLNYGTEAQLYFGHNTDSLMNASLTAEQQALVGAYDESMMDSVVSVDSTKAQNFIYDGSSFARRAPSVSFDGAFSINYYFTAANSPDDGMTLYYWNIDDYLAADVLTIDNATGSMEMLTTETEDQYWGNVTDIAAKELDQTVFVVGVYEYNGTTYSTGILNYSIGKYCGGIAANSASAQQAFAQATAVYGYCAKEYFANL